MKKRTTVLLKTVAIVGTLSAVAATIYVANRILGEKEKHNHLLGDIDDEVEDFLDDYEDYEDDDDNDFDADEYEQDLDNEDYTD